MNQLKTHPFIYTSLDDLLQDHTQDDGITYVLRHAERYPVRDWQDILTADLTPRGTEDAIEFGRRLIQRYQIGHIFSSPLKRCLNTAKAILSGAVADLPVQQHWWLFSPFFQSYNQNEYTLNVKASKGKEEILAHLDLQWFKVVLDRLKVPREPNQINIYVTHDSTVAPLIAYFEGFRTMRVDQYPPFLTGIVLRKDGLNKIKHYTR